MTNYYYQQGDVLLKRIEKIPDGTQTKRGSLVLQEGETTGHKHCFKIVGNEVEVLDTEEILSGSETIMPGVRKFIIVRDEVQLLHEEHKPITVLPGIYEMDLVREYDYDKHEMRRVID